MKENKYDDEAFFEQYSKMHRSIEGLKGAGEWHVLREMLPGFKEKRVLDLGCGFGWHCMYAVDQGASSVTGVDISSRMIEEAKKKNSSSRITYVCMAIEDFEFIPDTFDVVISSITFHYLESFKNICERIYPCLSDRGVFVFSVEHPVFTAYGGQDWYYDEEGNRLHWPVDRYFTEGKRNAVFLGEEVVKYHKILTTYINDLLETGFEITGLQEPKPPKEMLHYPGMQDELRRPMMLLISARKKRLSQK